MARSHLLKALRPARVTGRRGKGRHGQSGPTSDTGTGSTTGTSTGTHTHG